MEIAKTPSLNISNRAVPLYCFLRNCMQFEILMIGVMLIYANKLKVTEKRFVAIH